MQDQQEAIPGRASWAVVTALILACLAAWVAWLIFYHSALPPKVTCITLPEVTDESVQRSAMDLGIKLQDLPLDSHLKGNFEKMTTTTFQQLSDKQVAFLLLLRAVDCYLKAADTPEKKELVKEVSHELALTARAMWAAEHNLRGSGKELGFKERDILQLSPLGPAIVQELGKYGIQ